MSMTSLQRVLTTLSHKEPDRVPLFLLTSMHGAKELNMMLKEYYSSAENVAEGQFKLLKKYRSDCYYTFYYAPIEIEAFGGEVIKWDESAFNSGQPIISSPQDIIKLRKPNIEESESLQRVIKTTKLLKEEAGDNVPIIGVVMSPFSLPVMQMGFDHYLDLMIENPELFDQLMKVNEEFCVEWANAQITAGATAICYFDPVSSTTIIPPELYRKTGLQIAKRTLSRIQGATATHMASGRCLNIADDLCGSGTYGIATSVEEDLKIVKEAFKDKLTVLGNLNAIEMCRWTDEETENHVKNAIIKAGSGGGFILSDNHGEIPYQVPEKTLIKIYESVEKWGNYPISENGDE